MRQNFLRQACVVSVLGLGLAHGAAADRIDGYGMVAFHASCGPRAAGLFDHALAKLHAFGAERADFATVARAQPSCAIAWWGAAMSERGNPLAGEPDAATREAGRVDLAEAAKGRADPRERGLIDALALYYGAPGEYRVRVEAYEAAMAALLARFPDDAEIGAVTALAMLEAVDLHDGSYARQRRAGAILAHVAARAPDHPGALHYLIHAYDYPALALGALDAARRYPAVAPLSMHAQHMPSHIYSMLGRWDDSIAANYAAARFVCGPAQGAARDDADPHGMDFIAYAKLQTGDDHAVAADIAHAPNGYEKTVVEARAALERGDWAGAAAWRATASDPLDAVTVRFTRALGLARSGGSLDAARREIAALRAVREPVAQREGAYWAGLVDVYATAADAWIAQREGRADDALRLAREAADADDAREKHIFLENKLLPMRELLGSLLLAQNRPADALAAFEASAERAPNRFNGFIGSARAAKALGHADDARGFYAKAAALTAQADASRPEIDEARAAAAK